MDKYNGNVYIELLNRTLTKEDLTLITPCDGRRVMVKSCYIEDMDVSTLNPFVVFIDCYFVNAEAILPRPKLQLLSCIFTGSKGIRHKRCQIRPAVTTLGHYSPVIKREK